MFIFIISLIINYDLRDVDKKKEMNYNKHMSYNLTFKLH